MPYSLYRTPPGAFRVEVFRDLRFENLDLGFRFQGVGFRDWDLGCRVQGFGFRVQGFVQGSGFRVQGLGMRV